MFWRSKQRRKWLVSYMFSVGSGRVILTTIDEPLSSRLLEEMEDWIKKDSPDLQNVAVTNVVKMERVRLTKNARERGTGA